MIAPQMLGSLLNAFEYLHVFVIHHGNQRIINYNLTYQHKIPRNKRPLPSIRLKWVSNMDVFLLGNPFRSETGN